MNTDDILAKLCVKIESKFNSETSVGSGCIFYNGNDGIYIITAEHCLYGITYDENFNYELRENFSLNDLSIKYQIEEGKDFISLKPCKILFSSKITDDICIIKISKEELIKNNLYFSNILPIKILKTRFKNRKYKFKGYPEATYSNKQISLEGKEIDIPAERIRFTLTIDNLDGGNSFESIINHFQGFSGSGVFIVEHDSLYLVGIQKGLDNPNAYFNQVICHGLDRINEIMLQEMLPFRYATLPDLERITDSNIASNYNSSIGVKLPDGKSINGNREYVFYRKEIEKILSCINNPTNKKIIFLTGEAGSGKTSFLLSLVNIIRNEKYTLFLQYRDYISCDSIESLAKKLYHYCDGIQDFIGMLRNISERFIIVIDSLDVISWNEDKLNIFIDFIEHMINIECLIIISIRTFDLKNNATLSLFKPQSEQVNINKIEIEELEKLFGALDIKLPDEKQTEIFDFLSLPIRLNIFFQIYKNGKELSGLIDEMSLHKELWNKFLEDEQQKKKGVLEKHIFQLVELIFEQEKLDIPYILFLKSPGFNETAYNILISSGLLYEARNKSHISLFHQTFFDFIATKFLYQSGISVLDFIRKKQGLYFYLPTIRYYFQFLRVEENSNYLFDLNKILEKEEFDIIIKINVIRFLAEVKDPSYKEIQYVIDILARERYDKVFLKLANKHWFKYLYQQGFHRQLNRKQVYPFLIFTNRTTLKTENSLIDIIIELLRYKLESYELSVLLEICNQFPLSLLKNIFPTLYKSLVEVDKAYNKNWFSISEKMYRHFPHNVLKALMNNFINHGRLSKEEQELTQSIIIKFPDKIKIIIKAFEEFENERRKVSNETFDRQTKNTDEYFIFDSGSIWNYERKTFYYDFESGNSQIVLYILDQTIKIFSKSNIFEYEKVIRELTKSNYESLNRIAFLSALDNDYKKVILHFILNKKSYYASTISHFIKIYLEKIWNILSLDERLFLSKTIIERFDDIYQKLPDESKYLAYDFLLEIKNSFKNIEYPEILSEYFSKATMEIKKHYEEKGTTLPKDENEFIQYFSPSLGGIGDVKTGTSSFTSAELENSTNEERLTLLERFKTYKNQNNIGYWWVEDGRRLTEEVARDPIKYKSLANEIIKRNDLFRFRVFILRGLFEHQKQRKENKIENLLSFISTDDIADINIRLVKGEYPIIQDKDVGTPDFDFVKWVGEFYEQIPIIYRSEVKKEAVNIIKKSTKKNGWKNYLLNILWTIKKFFIFKMGIIINSNIMEINQEKKDYFGAAINSVDGIALEALSMIIYHEVDSNVEKDIYIRAGIDTNLKNRAIIGYTLINLKNHYPEDCLKILKIWTEEKDFNSLKYGVSYFYYYRREEVPVIISFLRKWINFFQLEIEKYENLSAGASFSSNCISLIVLLAKNKEDGVEKILQQLINSTEENSEQYQILIPRIITNLICKKETYQEILSPYLEMLALLKSSKVRDNVIFSVSNIPTKFLSKEKKRTIILSATRNGEFENFSSSYSLTKTLPELYNDNFQWFLELCQELFFNKKVIPIPYYELNNYGKILIDIYLNDSGKRSEVAILVNKLIALGWESGLNDISEIGR